MENTWAIYYAAHTVLDSIRFDSARITTDNGEDETKKEKKNTRKCEQTHDAIREIINEIK